MKKLILLFVCLLVTGMFAFGAVAQEAQAATTIKVINGSIPGKHNLKSIEIAIIKAATERGWVPVKVQGKNVIQCTLLVRTHTLIMDVVYSLDGYSINYVSSNNLDYNPANNTIHSKYDNWTNNLNMDIQKALAQNQIP